MKRWKTFGTLLCVLALLGFSVYALLDALVISRVYTVVETESGAQTAQTQTLSSRHSGGRGRKTERTETDAVSSATQKAEAAATAESSETAGVLLTLDTVRYENTTVYVADIQLDDPASLQTAFSRSSYGKNVTAATSETAEAVGAVLAVNGDNYGARETGYVIRDGVLYRDTAAKDQEDLVIWADGSFSIIREDEVTAQELLAQGAKQVFSFGPGLLADGGITVSATDEVGRAMASNPRTAIGIIAEGHYVLVVSDGRSTESEGLSLYELAQFMQGLGVQTAYNLDGGGSSTMVYNGAVVNQPSNGRERAVTDIIYIA